MNAVFSWFKDTGQAGFATAAIAAVSLVLAVIALIRSSRAQSRALAIEEERELDRKVRAKRAQLVARIVKRGERDAYWLEIENTGDAEARSLSFVLGELTPETHPALRMRPEDLVRQIGPHSKVAQLLILTFGEHPPYEFRATWEDDSGEPREYRTTLTF